MLHTLRLIVAGLLISGLSIGGWILTTNPETAGSPAAFEQALTPLSEPPVAGSRGPMVELGSGTEPIPSPPFGPPFTVSEPNEGVDRVPVGLRIPALDEEAPITLAGVEPNGEMEVPSNVTDVAWYKYGPVPGEAGSSVLAAHVDLAGRGPGVFFNLRNLEPGSVIYVDYEDGSTAAFRAEARATYDKSELPVDAIFSREGPAVLTLITCGGDFNRSLRSYESNVAVYAVPIDVAPPATI